MRPNLAAPTHQRGLSWGPLLVLYSNFSRGEMEISLNLGPEWLNNAEEKSNNKRGPMIRSVENSNGRPNGKTMATSLKGQP